MNQLKLFSHYNDKTLGQYLEAASGKSISLVITDNSTSVLSLKTGRESVALRLNKMFLSAENEVLAELAEFIKSRRKKTPLVRKFINQNAKNLKPKSPNLINIRPQGRYHDLLEMFNAVNREYFLDKVSASITWGANRPRRAAARRTLGSYSGLSKTIRINPGLDSKRVPRYFLEFIVYHEMLHADMGIGKGVKRRVIHSKEFKRREKLFKDYDRAVAWEKQQL